MSEDLSTAKVAERFNVTPSNVRLWIKRGLFPHAYEREESRGSVWMIPAKDLEGFEPPKRTGRPPKPKGGGVTKTAQKRARKGKRSARS